METLDFELEVGGQWFSVNTAPLRDEYGWVSAVIELAQDITERKLSEGERERPDVLVSDIGMPGEDGYWLIREARSHGDNVPAAALTAYASEADRERALAAGFQAHVTKPIEPAALISAVAEAAKGGMTSREDSPD